MLITKVLNTRIDLSNTDIIQYLDNNALISRLTSKYKDRCMHSCLILKINKIIRRSMIYLSTELTGGGHINVCFEVDAIIYSKGDIITGCKINKIDSSKIYAISKYAGLQINISNNLIPIYKENDIVPFIAQNISYMPGKHLIAIIATPFVPGIMPDVFYKVTKPLTDIEKEVLISLFGELDNLYKQIITYQENKEFQFFQDLIYPYKKNMSIELKNFKSIVLDQKIISENFIYLVKPNKIKNIASNKTSIYVSNTYDGEYREESLYIVLDMYIRDILKHFTNILDLVKEYPDIESIKKYQLYWKLYNMLKK